MKATPAGLVRVAHVFTESDRSEAHEQAVNARLGALGRTAQVVGTDHSAHITDTPDGLAYLFSTLITYWTMDFTRTGEVDL